MGLLLGNFSGIIWFNNNFTHILIILYLSPQQAGNAPRFRPALFYSYFILINFNNLDSLTSKLNGRKIEQTAVMPAISFMN